MCYVPKHITNPTSAYKAGVDKIYIDVPCGDCAECQAKNQEEWFMRSYAEWLNSCQNGLMTLFVTLTFDNYHLPNFEDYGIPLDMPCFSPELKDSFLSKLKTYLCREFKYCHGFKYLWCDEYGEKYHRPHSHVLLTIPNYKGYILRKVKNLIRKAWSNGHIYFSREDKGGAVVSNKKAIRYVSKYITKQWDFVNTPEVKQLLSYYKDNDDLVPEESEQLLKQLKRHMPRHYQSKGYGACMCEWLAITDDDDNFIIKEDAFDLLTKGYQIPISKGGDDDVKFYSIPRYVFNKLAYKVRKDGVRVLTPCGFALKKLTIDKEINDATSEFEKNTTLKGLCALVGNSDVQSIFPKSSFHNVIDIYNFICQTLKNRTAYDVIVYKRIYQNRSYYQILPYYGFDDEYFQTYPLCQLIANAGQMFENQYQPYIERNTPTPEEVKNISFDSLIEKYGTPWSQGLLLQNRLDDEKLYLYNYLPAFSGFDAILYIYGRLLSNKRKLSYKANRTKDRTIQRVREQHYQLNLL